MVVGQAAPPQRFQPDNCQKLFDPSAHLGDNPEDFYQIGR
jgi:hypothetical protein